MDLGLYDGSGNADPTDLEPHPTPLDECPDVPNGIRCGWAFEWPRMNPYAVWRENGRHVECVWVEGLTVTCYH